MKDLQDIVHELKQKGVFLKATEQPIAATWIAVSWSSVETLA
jgi:hypothetical protein